MTDISSLERSYQQITFVKLQRHATLFETLDSNFHIWSEQHETVVESGRKETCIPSADDYEHPQQQDRHNVMEHHLKTAPLATVKKARSQIFSDKHLKATGP
ncbi:hypothetical protein RB195_015347 [Necator americanus]|uniref:Uncharacterized protein n=1 Tax=Necator americanus TaxID=51031 RepID=A0ABR1E5B2_NECAM